MSDCCVLVPCMVYYVNDHYIAYCFVLTTVNANEWGAQCIRQAIKLVTLNMVMTFCGLFK
jgi:hypothetical protein